MKDRILESYLDDFIQENNLGDIDRPKAFERFANYCIIAREHAEDFDYEQITVGGNNDSAIDGLGFIVNEHLVSAKEDIQFFKNSLHRLDVRFIFIQSKTADKFSSGEIGNFLFGVKSFFQKNPQIKENKEIQQLRELKEYIYDSSIDMNVSPICQMYYVTTGKWTEDTNLRGRIDLTVSELEQTALFSEVQFIPIDADRLKTIYKELKLKVVKEIVFDKYTILPKIHEVQEAYIGILPCPEYLKLITDSEGKLLRTLFYDNVRDFQGNNPVNMEIQETLKNLQHNDKFALLNNGITIVANSINKVGTSFKIRDYQIVNGCQTSHVLFMNSELITDKVYLPIKLIVTDNPEVTNAVIKATNRQTEVTLEAFEALTPFQKTLEEFYITFGKEKSPKLYYERRSKQYSSLPINRQHIVSLTAQIKSFLAMFLNEPHSTHRYYGELLRANRNRIFLHSHVPYPYYLSGYALCRIEDYLNKHNIDRYYRQFKYQMLFLFRIQHEPFQLPYLNSKKIDGYCSKLLDILSDDVKSLEAFDDTTRIIKDVLKKTSYHPRDAVRLRAFTAELANTLPLINDRQIESIASVKRETGEVTWFSDIRGFGFIKGAEHDQVFVHINDTEGAGYRSLKQRQKVEFTVVKTAQGLQAKDVILL